MRKSLSILFAMALLGGFGLALQENANVAGVWELSMEMGERGPMTQEMTISQDGEKIEVTMKSPRGESKGAGTVKGNAIEWSITRTTPRGEMTSTYKGIVEGDKMSGEVAMGPMGSVKWTADRKK